MKVHDMKKVRVFFLVVSVLVLLQTVAGFAQISSTIQERKVSLDPYGNKAVLGYLLRLPVLLNLVSTELGMTESQKDAFAQVVKSEEKELDDLYRTSSYYGAEVYNERYRQILLNTDTELRKLLSPIQYASLRDWIIEQWALERGEAALPLDEIIRMSSYINLLKSELALSSQQEEKVSSILIEYKEKTLPLKRRLVSLAQNPLTSREKLKTEGRRIVQNIRLLKEKLDEANIPEVSAMGQKEGEVKIYKDQRYGFKVKYLGELIQCSEAEVCIQLPLEEKVREKAVIRIFVNEKPFVFLGGTYGGHYYFEENPTALLSNRIFTEKVILNGIPFKKGYWVVYGGAGSWDTVINCYTEYNGKYYIISLDYNFISGIPGSEFERGGKRIKITREEIANKALSEMRNAENKYVRMFNEILSTFMLSK